MKASLLLRWRRWTATRYGVSSCIPSPSPTSSSYLLTATATATATRPLLSSHPLAAASRSTTTISSIHFRPLRFLSPFSTATPAAPGSGGGGVESDDTELEDGEIEWEEEEEVEAEIGDGGDGGGVVLKDVVWGERALSAAREILSLHFGDDIDMYAFKVSPKGYIYVRLDKLTNKYGCPRMEEIEKFNTLYKKLLDEIGVCEDIPLDLAVEVSSPGAERLLKVPDDLDRFKEMPMRVQYVEEIIGSNHNKQKEGVFMLEVVDTESGECSWKLADVKENRAEQGKGRPLSRKQKDWRLKLPFQVIRKAMLYLT